MGVGGDIERFETTIEYDGAQGKNGEPKSELVRYCRCYGEALQWIDG